MNIGRNAWLQAGLALEVAGTTVDFQCGSSQQALNLGFGLVGSRARNMVIAAGVEHMGHVPLGVGAAMHETAGHPFPPQLTDRYQLVPQGVAAERVAAKWDLEREELDEWALRSHQNAARAQDEGRFDREIVPVEAPHCEIGSDQGVRRDTSLERLGALKPAFVEDGVITAGNSSQISDGAAAILVTSSEQASWRDRKARAKIVDHVVVGVDPVLMLTGPIDATKLLLERTDRSIDTIDLFEVNEAFAPVVVAWLRELEADPERVNVNGGAMALGHPLGGSGAPHHDRPLRTRAGGSGIRSGDDVLRRRPRDRDAHPAPLEVYLAPVEPFRETQEPVVRDGNQGEA